MSLYDDEGLQKILTAVNSSGSVTKEEIDPVKFASVCEQLRSKGRSDLAEKLKEVFEAGASLSGFDLRDLTRVLLFPEIEVLPSAGDGGIRFSCNVAGLKVFRDLIDEASAHAEVRKPLRILTVRYMDPDDKQNKGMYLELTLRP